MENFVDFDEWFVWCLVYICSIVVILMFGYVLGFGDCYGYNILLDMKIGEVVYIDFGVVFEVGCILLVLELVLFRLICDIVDGMGIIKIEGVFCCCCEFIFDVLCEE